MMQARVPTPAREAQEATASSRPTSTEIASLIEGFEDDFNQVCTQMPFTDKVMQHTMLHCSPPSPCETISHVASSFVST